MDIKNTNLYNELVKRESGYIDNINKVYALAEEFLPKINYYVMGGNIRQYMKMFKMI